MFHWVAQCMWLVKRRNLRARFDDTRTGHTKKAFVGFTYRELYIDCIVIFWASYCSAKDPPNASLYFQSYYRPPRFICLRASCGHSSLAPLERFAILRPPGFAIGMSIGETGR